MAFKSSLLISNFFLLFFFSITTTNVRLCSAQIPGNNLDRPQSDSDCTGRWIHIRQLPPSFNLDLLSNSFGYPLLDDFYPYLANNGLGQKTHNLSHSWYRTDPLMLELIFHRRMLEYPCLASDPQYADAVYLPYYAGIDALRYLYGPDYNSSSEQGLNLLDFLTWDDPVSWYRHMGQDHFLVLARPAMDFSQPLGNDPPLWGTSLLELPQFFNVTALTVEARAWPWQEHAVPYPTSFHPPNLSLLEMWLQRARRSRRQWRSHVGARSGGRHSPRRETPLNPRSSPLPSRTSPENNGSRTSRRPLFFWVFCSRTSQLSIFYFLAQRPVTNIVVLLGGGPGGRG